MTVRNSVFALLILGLAACQPKSENIAEKLKRQSEEIQRETDKKAEEELRKKDVEKYVGGLPAAIFLSKSLVDYNNDSSFKPVEQIQVKLTGGTGKDGNPLNVTGEKLIQINESQAPEGATPLPEKTYINIGCSNLSAADIGDYKEVKLKLYTDEGRGNRGAMLVQAARVFICGTAVAKHSLVQIYANELAMYDATLEMKDNLFQFLVRAKNFILHGKNKITHKARKNALPSKEAQAFITLISENKIFGDGKLEIVSEGSSYQAPEGGVSPEPKKEEKKIDSTKK